MLPAAFAAAPIALHGAYCGDDYQFHLISWLDAQQSWRHGILYPHWTPSPNYGAGEPRFVFYPPLTWMMGAALGLVLPWSWVPIALIFLLVSGTGLATLMLARRLLPEGPAVLAGCAAMFSLYALFTAYERAAFGELAGGLWIPLLLLFALRDRKPSACLRSRVWPHALDRSTVPLALVLAGAWLSDAPLGLMASYLLAAIALVAAVHARSWAPVARASIAAALGIGLCGLYLVPAAYEQRWVDMRQATGAAGDPGLLIENNWLFARHSSPELQLHDVEAHLISVLSVILIAGALLSLLTVWLRGRLAPLGQHDGPPQPESGVHLARRWWVPLALIPISVLFLQLPLSRPVWDLLPRLHFLQFPWRWLLVVEAPMGIFFAAAIWPASSARRWQRAIALLAGVLFFAGSLLFAYDRFFRVCLPDDSLPSLLSRHHSGAGFWGADEYAPPDADNSTVATGLPDACLAGASNVDLGIAANPDSNPIWRPEQGSCEVTATAILRQPEHLRIAMIASHAGSLILRLRSYPAWRVTVNGRVATGVPGRVDGLIAVPVPQGPVEVTVDWTTTADVIAGRWLSGFSLLLLLAVGRLECRLSWLRSSAEVTP